MNGRKPTGNILPAGQGTPVLEFRLLGGNVVDNSFDPEPVASPRVPASVTDNVFAPIALPSLADVTPRLTRTFRFERGNGQWQINGQLMDCTRYRFRFQRNTFERWILQNSSAGWEHPVHIHLEEFRIIRRNGRLVRPGESDFGRQDVVLLGQPVRGDGSPDRCPDHLGGLIPEQPLGRPIPRPDRPVEIVADDSVLARVDDGRQVGGAASGVAKEGAGVGGSAAFPSSVNVRRRLGKPRDGQPQRADTDP